MTKRLHLSSYIGRVNLGLPYFRDMFKDRAEVFIDRLGWDTQRNDWGGEFDDFDLPDTTYIVLHNAAGEHVASCRHNGIDVVSPMATKLGFDVHNRLDDYYGMGAVPPPIVEISRTVLSPRLDARDDVYRARVLAYMSRLHADYLYEHTDYRGAIATFYSPMLRIYRRFGYAPEVLDNIKPKGDKKINLGLWTQSAYQRWVESGNSDLAIEGKKT